MPGKPRAGSREAEAGSRRSAAAGRTCWAWNSQATALAEACVHAWADVAGAGVPAARELRGSLQRIRAELAEERRKPAPTRRSSEARRSEHRSQETTAVLKGLETELAEVRADREQEAQRLASLTEQVERLQAALDKVQQDRAEAAAAQSSRTPETSSILSADFKPPPSSSVAAASTSVSPMPSVEERARPGPCSDAEVLELALQVRAVPSNQESCKGTPRSQSTQTSPSGLGLYADSPSPAARESHQRPSRVVTPPVMQRRSTGGAPARSLSLSPSSPAEAPQQQRQQQQRSKSSPKKQSPFSLAAKEMHDLTARRSLQRRAGR